MSRLSVAFAAILFVLVAPNNAVSQSCQTLIERCMTLPLDCAKSNCLVRLAVRQCGNVDVIRLQRQAQQDCKASMRDRSGSGVRRPEIRYTNPNLASKDIAKAFDLFGKLSVVMGGLLTGLTVWGVAAAQGVALAKAWPWILAGSVVGALLANFLPDATQILEASTEWFRSKIP